MGGKQSTAGATAAGRSRGGGGGGGGPLAGVASDDSAVGAPPPPPPGGAPHFGHYRGGGGNGGSGGGGGGSSAMGLRSRSVSSVAGVGVGMGGVEPAGAGSVPFGLYAAAAAASAASSATTAASTATAAAAAAASGDSERGPGADSTPYGHGNGYQETGGGHHRDGMLYLGSRASLADALPLHLGPRWFSSHSGFKCPVCSKSVASDEMEMHFIMCLSKPRLSYNDDVLTKDSGECVICLEELLQGDTIARLPCLCIYHKSCIDSWFEVNRSCPEHPSD
ncbi:E3 ubiquitin-protein ligase ZNRF1 [Pseudonaja textilis]|uniref:E3 ubiquitin-protein ligase ZNRF1 n=1 Tax=Pseudonaja textilis TaxID=8673 RepID=A0A670YHH6_PSETE|nr:E3 ubiquitin-protein ligase ZNRF1 [Pseudonaja textilis]